MHYDRNGPPYVLPQSTNFTVIARLYLAVNPDLALFGTIHRIGSRIENNFGASTEKGLPDTLWPKEGTTNSGSVAMLT